MLTKRIIPCLDIANGNVVKGVRFQNHEILGSIESFAKFYEDEGADELVLYDILASPEGRTVDTYTVDKIAKLISIPFCVAGGIKSVDDAQKLLLAGADKVSINSPALANPELITDIAKKFGSQCVVIGIDSKYENGSHNVYKYTGDPNKSSNSAKNTADWAKEVQERGAGEIVLNCMNYDGVREGYDTQHCKEIVQSVTIPVIASGGAGKVEDFENVFKKADVSGALAASIFHKKIVSISSIKRHLISKNIPARV